MDTNFVTDQRKLHLFLQEKYKRRQFKVTENDFTILLFY